jgi:cyclopropane fatty-acyl-phospholipid synthase-like methyltransferase
MNKLKIKSMKLYNNVGRIFNELKEIGKDKSKILKVEDLIKFDQLHYCGIDAVDFAIINTKINSSKSILEIGSGIGGPARYIGYKTRASVTALELQADHHKIALDLTKKCKLLKNVNHIRGDILNYNWKNKKFDVVVSWLALYHIKDHNKLLKNSFNLIKKNGYFFSEDLISLKKLNNKNLSELSNDLYANYLPSYETYLNDLEKKGFEIIYHKNMSQKWAAFVRKRKMSYEDNKNRNIRVHGEKTYENISYFYKIVDKYFSSQKIGGIKVIAKKNKG